ncbi:methyl-accepting chemotaxis protein [Haloferax chudinovii]|uniref:Methyl-accepting chemotaxis protein n=1 Tax=Haloferax chudinovii TaxID=1109010 RepID=A0ABD5XHN3_9EURY
MIIDALFDAIGALGFIGAAVLAWLNYRDTEAEASFWLTYAFASVLAILWMVSLTMEKLGIYTEIFNLVTSPLMTATVAVFAIGGTATLAIVADMKELVDDADERRRELDALTTDLERQAESYGDAMQTAADGDLTVRVDAESDNDAMRRIGRGFNEMVEAIDSVVVRIQTFAEQVDDESSEVTASADAVKTTSTDVANSIEEISAGNETQHRNLNAAESELSNLSATIEEIASSSEEIARQSEQTVGRAKESREAASSTIEKMEQLESRSTETVAEVEDLQQSVTQISEVVDLIDDIAEKTSILALNASIEAAGAGDAGEGFAVVASEVKTLAEETAEATQEVDSLIGDIEQSTENVAEDTFETQAEVEASRETVGETVDVLEEIVHKIEDSNDSIQSISSATDEQAQSTQEVVTMMDEITNLSDRTASEAQNVSAAAEEQTAATQQIAASSSSLSERAQQLKSLVSQFDSGRATGGVPGGETATPAASAPNRAMRADGVGDDRPN